MTLLRHVLCRTAHSDARTTGLALLAFCAVIQILLGEPLAAVANLKLDRLDEARRHLHDALEIDRTPLPAREVQGILLYREGKYEASHEVLEDVIARAPGRALAHHFLSVALRELGELESALQHHQEAERLNRHPFRPRRDPSELERGMSTARARCAKDLRGIVVCLP